jgi:ADP-ribosylation factor-like protein 8
LISSRNKLILCSGKTTLLQVLSDGRPAETAPTIGLNVRMVKRGGITMKCWDLGGQSQYRAEWGRYTRGCNVIIFVVDANAIDILPDVKIELHRLLEDRCFICSSCP